jgi:YD repeat-containing protein
MNQHFPLAKTGASAPSAKKGRVSKAAVPPRRQKVDRVAKTDTVAKTIEVIERYFDPEGRPIKHKTLGAARVARRYDRRGNQIEESYYNSCGKPTERRDLGAASIAWRYDENGRRLGADFFSADGALIAHEEPEPPKAPAVVD